MGLRSRWQADAELARRAEASRVERERRRHDPWPPGVVLLRARWSGQDRLVVAVEPVSPGSARLADRPGAPPAVVDVVATRAGRGPGDVELRLADGRVLAATVLLPGEQGMADVGHGQPVSLVRQGPGDLLEVVVWRGAALWAVVSLPFRLPARLARRRERDGRAAALLTALRVAPVTERDREG